MWQGLLSNLPNRTVTPQPTSSTFRPLQFGYLWPGNDRLVDNTATISITHKATGTIIQCHLFILKWLRQYCACWKRHFEGRDEAALIDAIASLDLSAEDFKTFWRILYGATLASNASIKVESFGDSAAAIHKRARWLSLLCERVVVPGMAYTRAMCQLLKNREWFQAMQEVVSKNIDTFISESFIGHLMSQASEHDVKLDEHWFFTLPSPTSSSNKNSADTPMPRDTSTNDDWTQLGNVLGAIILNHCNGDDQVTRAWHQISVTIISKLFQGAVRHVRYAYEHGNGTHDNRIRAKQAIWDALCDVTRLTIAPGRLLGMCTEVSMFAIQFNNNRLPVNHNLSLVGPKPWHQAISKCMAYYASTHIFKATPLLLQQLARNTGGEDAIIAMHYPFVAPEPNFTVEIEGGGDENIYAVHDFVLAQWAYFQRLMAVEMTEAKERRLTLPANFSPKALRIILGLVYGVDLNSRIAINDKIPLIGIDEDTLQFLVNECATAYDLVVVPEDDDSRDSECTRAASSSSSDNEDVIESLMRRLKHSDLEHAAAQRDSDLSLLPMPQDFSNTDLATGIRSIATAGVALERLVQVTVPNLVERKVSNTPRLAAGFAALIDLLIVLMYRRDQFVTVMSHIRALDCNAETAATFAGLPVTRIPTVSEIGVASQTLCANASTIVEIFANRASEYAPGVQHGADAL